MKIALRVTVLLLVLGSGLTGVKKGVGFAAGGGLPPLPPNPQTVTR
jgi:hypothetical protein